MGNDGGGGLFFFFKKSNKNPTKNLKKNGEEVSLAAEEIKTLF